MKMLVTGFDAFGSITSNPSETLAQVLADRDPDVISRTLPTSYDRGWKALKDAITDEGPDCVVMFGYAHGVEGLRVERRGINRVRSHQADNDGKRQSSKIDEDGPQYIETHYDVAVLCDSILASGCPAKVSIDAGGYVCNYVYFRTLREIASTPSLFVHLSAYENLAGSLTVNRGAAALIETIKQESQ